MTLYLIRDGQPVAWTGEAIGETRYPADIETLWSDADLAAIGLYRAAAADPVPDGKVVTGTSVQLVDGVPKTVNTLGDPPFASLTKRQVCAALINAGLTDDPNGFVLGVLATIPDAKAKALAINDWDNAPFYTRDNPLFADPSLLAAGGITTDQIDQFWRLGETLPA